MPGGGGGGGGGSTGNLMASTRLPTRLLCIWISSLWYDRTRRFRLHICCSTPVHVRLQTGARRHVFRQDRLIHLTSAQSRDQTATIQLLLPVTFPAPVVEVTDRQRLEITIVFLDLRHVACVVRQRNTLTPWLSLILHFGRSVLSLFCC